MASRNGTTRGQQRTELFTLIELLVVIAIVMILTSMLLPAVTQSKARMEQTSCMNRVKQIGMAVIMYTDEQDDFMPPAQMSAPYDHWLNYMYAEELQRNPKSLQCPSLQQDQMFNPYGGDGEYAELKKASFIMNIIREKGVHGWTHIGADISTDVDVSLGWVAGTATTPIKSSRPADPGSKIYVTDTPPGLTHNSTAIGILRLHETDHGLIDPNGNGSVNAEERQIAWQHFGHFNALYGDGHGELKKRSEHEEWNVHQMEY